MPITPETLEFIQQVAAGIITDDLKTQVTVMRRSRSAENAYGTSAETWTSDQTYLGWLVEKSAADLTRQGTLAGGVNEFELRLPLDAVIEPGDRVVIGSAIYTVQNTNNEDTLPVFMEATLRRVI